MIQVWFAGIVVANNKDKLMCFNVYAHNRNDHSKNFTYSYDENEMICICFIRRNGCALEFAFAKMGKIGTNEQFFRSVMTYFGYNKRRKLSID